MTSLGEVVTAQLTSMSENHETLDNLMDELKEAQKTLRTLPRDILHIRPRNELECRITSLEKRIEARRCETSLRNPSLQDVRVKTMPYLQAQEACITRTQLSESQQTYRNTFEKVGGQIVQRSRTSDSSHTLVSDYLEHVAERPPDMRVHEDDECDVCKGRMHIISGCMTCSQCGQTRKHMDITGASMKFDDMKPTYTAFAYNPMGHFRECIDQFQAKETTQVPVHVIEKVKATFTGADLKTLAMSDVHEALKALRYKQYYRYKTQVWHRVTGQDPPRLTREQEAKCLSMFAQIQEPYLRHRPANRSNFLSYNLCLYRFLQMIGCHSLCKYIELLKGQDKRHIQDEILRNICAELKWTYPD